MQNLAYYYAFVLIVVLKRREEVKNFIIFHTNLQFTLPYTLCFLVQLPYMGEINPNIFDPAKA